MFKKLLFVIVFVFSLVSCQFTETMTLHEDGTGSMSISMDLSEMMAFTKEMGADSTNLKQDTIIVFKDVFEAKKDSIAKLPPEKQAQLKKMENYKLKLFSDPDTGTMIVDVFTDFKNIAEANDLMEGFAMSDQYVPGNEMASGDSPKNKEEADFIGVTYAFKNGTFLRDAFIKDEQAHQQQLDSLKQAESFMSSMKYKLKYTFPKKIKTTSAEDASFSLDGKTIILERSFLDYLKDPDVLDLQVELEE